MNFQNGSARASRPWWDSDLTKNDIWMIRSEYDQVTFCCLLQHNVSCGRSQNLQAYEWLYSDTTFFLNNILKVSLVGEGTIRFCQIKTNITIRPSGVSTMKLEKTCLKKFPEKANYETFSQRYLQNGCKSQYLTNAALCHQQHVCIIYEKH